MAGTGRRRSGWVRQEMILEGVRGEIIRGELGPGARVPTRDELERRFRASRVTIQRAFDALIREGFVESRGRSGTFVSTTPPHLFRTVLVFPLHGEALSRRSSFEQALQREARRITRKGPEEVGVFDGIRCAEDWSRFRSLEDDVRDYRVGGLIFIGAPDPFAGSRLLTSPAFPRVSLSPTGTPESMARIELDRREFFEQALALVPSRRRAALLTSRRDGDEDIKAFGQALDRAGTGSAPYWQHRVEVADGEACRNLVELLMRGPGTHRPDALFLTEELLLPRVLEGLSAAGVDAARDLTLIVRSYLGGDDPALAPAIVMRYDVHGMLNTCLALLQAQRVPRAEITASVCRLTLHGGAWT